MEANEKKQEAKPAAPEPEEEKKEEKAALMQINGWQADESDSDSDEEWSLWFNIKPKINI